MAVRYFIRQKAVAAKVVYAAQLRYSTYSLFFIVHAHRNPGNSRQFKGVSKLFAQGSIPTGEK